MIVKEVMTGDVSPVAMFLMESEFVICTTEHTHKIDFAQTHKRNDRNTTKQLCLLPAGGW